jgi:subtilisin family serine protease
VRGRDVGRLRRAGLVRAVEPERRLSVESRAIDPRLQDEWSLASVGASGVSAPGPGVPVAIVDTGLDVTHPEFAARPDTTSLKSF